MGGMEDRIMHNGGYRSNCPYFFLLSVHTYGGTYVLYAPVTQYKPSLRPLFPACPGRVVVKRWSRIPSLNYSSCWRGRIRSCYG